MRRAGRALASSISVLSIGLISLLGAVPAQAAANPSNLYLYCNVNTLGVFSDAGATTPVTSVSAANGDTLVLNFLTPTWNNISDPCNSGYGYNANASLWNEPFGGGSTETIFLLEFNGTQLAFRMTASTGTTATVTVNFGGGGGGGSSDPSSGSGSGPSAVIQQFGMPATGTCNEAQPEGLNLAGVPSGGWGISWAQWMNGGTGGAVCTRTLNYSTVQSKWVVN